MAIETLTEVDLTISYDNNNIEKLLNINKEPAIPSLFKKITASQSPKLSLRTTKQSLQKSIPNS